MGFLHTKVGCGWMDGYHNLPIDPASVVTSLGSFSSWPPGWRTSRSIYSEPIFVPGTLATMQHPTHACVLHRWKEAMVELLDELELLDPMSSQTAQEMTSQQDNVEKFQHYATMYIRCASLRPARRHWGEGHKFHVEQVACVLEGQGKRVYVSEARSLCCSDISKSSGNLKRATTRWSTRRSAWTSRRR